MIDSVEKSHKGSSPPKKEGRLFYIDNLKSTLTILVVLHHLVFLSNNYEVLTPDSIGFGVGILFLAINQSFFMGVFFLISGYFLPSSFERNGATRFVKDRLIRFFIPFIFYVLVLSQVQSIGDYILNDEAFTWNSYLSHLTYGPMWYVELLLIFFCLYAVWAKWISKRPLSEVCQSKSPTYTTLTVFVILLAIGYFTIRLWIPALDLPGGSPEIQSFVGLLTVSGYDLPQYIALFILGIIAYQRNWFRTIPDSMGRAGFWIAIIASLTFLPLALIFGLEGFRFSGGWNWTSLVFSLWGSLFCVGITFGLITFFRKRISHQGKVWRFLSTHSYTIYIIHMPIIAVVITTLMVIDVPSSFVFPSTVLISISLILLLSYLVRKIPYMSRIL